MAFFTTALPWHPGEQKIQTLLLNAPLSDNPTATTLTPQASYMLQRAPLLALGTLDAQDRPWTTLWGGLPGFSEPLGGSMIGTRTIVDGAHDPVVEALVGKRKSADAEGAMVPGNEKMVSGLSIDLMTRKRVKLFGRMLAGSLDDVKVDLEGEVDAEGEDAPSTTTQTRIQLVTKIEQSMGNCPKYLNQYEIDPARVRSELIWKGASIMPAVKDLISHADMFFLSSSTSEDMDTNHRGGPPGFVRILSDTEIVYPEYSGNRLYQTLGNLEVNPKVGMVFPDYETGEVVYLTGTAEILVREDAAKLLPGSNLALKITVSEVRLVKDGLPFRGVRRDASPYNPLVRKLASEGNIKAAYSTSRQTATLVRKTKIAPKIARFTFAVPEGIAYKPGQWVALDFSKELDLGYSHMRNDDPRSLNDDFVRTFTISSSPESGASDEKTFDITIRNVGVATDFLLRQPDTGGLQISVLGVGGDFHVQPEKGKGAVFIAGGVGITPLLGQLPSLNSVLPTALKLLWSVKAEDIAFVEDTLAQYPQLTGMLKLYITGETATDAISASIQELSQQGVSVLRRRLNENDLQILKKKDIEPSTWYVCAAKPLRKDVLQWLDGQRVLFEDFDY